MFMLFIFSDNLFPLTYGDISLQIDVIRCGRAQGKIRCRGEGCEAVWARRVREYKALLRASQVRLLKFLWVSRALSLSSS